MIGLRPPPGGPIAQANVMSTSSRKAPEMTMLVTLEFLKIFSSTQAEYMINQAKIAIKWIQILNLFRSALTHVTKTLQGAFKGVICFTIPV